MAPMEQGAAEPCAEHDCCIRAVHVEAPADRSRLSGEWHLRWMADDRSWFLVPPHGNVREIRVAEDADPTEQLAVDGLSFDEIQRSIDRRGLFPPC